ncbi:hypothetical protein D3C85_1572060 [compost metagenome]
MIDRLTVELSRPKIGRGSNGRLGQWDQRRIEKKYHFDIISHYGTASRVNMRIDGCDRIGEMVNRAPTADYLEGFCYA